MNFWLAMLLWFLAGQIRRLRLVKSSISCFIPLSFGNRCLTIAKSRVFAGEPKTLHVAQSTPNFGSIPIWVCVTIGSPLGYLAYHQISHYNEPHVLLAHLSRFIWAEASEPVVHASRDIRLCGKALSVTWRLEHIQLLYHQDKPT